MGVRGWGFAGIRRGRSEVDFLVRQTERGLTGRVRGKGGGGEIGLVVRTRLSCQVVVVVYE